MINVATYDFFHIIYPSEKRFLSFYILYICLGFKKLEKAIFFTQKYVYNSSVVQEFAKHILCLDEFAFSHVCADIIFLNK